MSEVKLNSHVLHPQIKSEHCNAESAKLTNHDTSPVAASLKSAFGTPASNAAPTSNNTTKSESSGKSISSMVTGSLNRIVGKK